MSIAVTEACQTPSNSAFLSRKYALKATPVYSVHIRTRGVHGTRGVAVVVDVAFVPQEQVLVLSVTLAPESIVACC
jgi:hypothetical protein